MNLFIKPLALCAFLVANVLQVVAQCPNAAITVATTRIINSSSLYAPFPPFLSAPFYGWFSPQARLPNGTIVTSAGTYQNVIKSIRYPLCDSIVYTVTVVNDNTCRIPDSLKLLTARQLVMNKGLNPGWDLTTPFSTWNGVVMNPVTNCVDTAHFYRNTETCVDRNGSYTASLFNNPNNIWMIPNAEFAWYRNNRIVARTTVPILTINGISPSDTGMYKVVMTAPNFPIGSIEMVRLKFCCTAGVYSESQTIRFGRSVLWGNLNRTQTGTYRDTLVGQNFRGCDSIRILNLTVLNCTLTGELNTFGNTVVMNASGGVRPYQYRWSSGAATSYDAWTRSGLYKVTVTDGIGCEIERDTLLGNPPIPPPYRLGNVSVPCNTVASASVVLTKNVSNIEGYTFEVTFDATKLVPIAANHTLGATLVNQSASIQAISGVMGNKFRITVGLSGANNYSGSIGDTILNIAFAALNPNFIPVDPISTLTVKVDENVFPAIVNVHNLISNSYSVGSNSVAAWILYHGIDLMNVSTSPIYNATYANTYQGRNSGWIGAKTITNGIGILPLGEGVETWVQLNRTSQTGQGSPTIGGYDAYLTARVVNQDTILSVPSLIAMDVNQSGTLTAADVTHILRRAVGRAGYLNGFAKLDNGPICSWLFFPKEKLTLDPAFQMAQIYNPNRTPVYQIPAIDASYKLNAAYRTRCDTGVIDIVSILLGDVNGDYVAHGMPARFGKEPSGSTTVTKRLDKLNAAVTFEDCRAIYLGDLTWKIPVKSNVNVGGLDLHLKNRNTNLQILSVTEGTNSVLLYNIDSANNCFISTYARQGASIQAETPICYITVKGTVLTPIATQLGTIQAFINGANAVSVLPCPSITNPVESVKEELKISIFPNPTNSSITVQHADIASKTIQVFNILGRLISEVQAGNGSTMVDLSDFAK
ncbi:MAG: hypothetical protein RIS64_4519, partial [Bacteroidota bacterium]